MGIIKKTFNLCLFMLIIVVVFSFPGCQNSGDDSSTIVEANMIKSNLERNLSPTLEPGDLTQLVEGNTAFALDFYHEAAGEPGNFIFSPHSISVAFAMTYAGARNNTEAQMAQTLHFNLPRERLHAAFNALDLALNSRGQGGGDSEGTDFKLHIVNAAWAQDGYSFLQNFLDVLAVNYGAGMYILDFITDPEGARQTINNWVAQQTEDKIKDLLPRDAINPLTRLVLTNAIYFYGAWAVPFDEVLTENGNFYLVDGDVISVPMMSLSPENSETLPAVVLDGYTAVDLPYKGREIAMLILVPDRGRFFEFEQALDANLVARTVDSLVPWDLRLKMPKFKYESKVQLKEPLSRMGMPEAFDPYNADFSGMNGLRELFIQDAFHKAFISVDEKGTEAAAATAVVITLTGAGTPFTVIIDRPFIYLIRDIETGAILFVGRVMNPEE
ncbi:MAG: serpin family protein [Candidatus Aminicenantes bacterium]|nr:MAG: serpin family protein [Candidatus Aminicenantes bacterium]